MRYHPDKYRKEELIDFRLIVWSYEVNSKNLTLDYNK